jgi:hypothetical protein
VTSNIKGHFLSVLHEGRTEQNKDISTGFLTFPIRQMGYAFARQLSEHATTIQAVDFMEPGTWLAEPMLSYAEAQGRNTQAKKKERIHIF